MKINLRMVIPVILVLMVLAIAVAAMDEVIYGSKNYCLEESEIISVDEIVYRGGWVTLKNGERRNVYQSGGKVGDFLCVKYGHRSFFKPRTVEKKSAVGGGS